MAKLPPQSKEAALGATVAPFDAARILFREFIIEPKRASLRVLSRFLSRNPRPLKGSRRFTRRLPFRGRGLVALLPRLHLGVGQLV
jgi:hypothetical protein